MMNLTRARRFSSIAAAALALWAGPALAQNQPSQPGQPTQPGQPGGGGSPEQRQQQMQQMRQMVEGKMKTLLQCSDDEFAVLKPRIEKVQQMQSSNDSRRVGIGMLLGGAGGNWRARATPPSELQKADAPKPDGAAPAAGNRPPGGGIFGNMADTPAYLKAREIQEALESKEATDTTFKVKLAELRAAKLQAKQEMARAQEELRQVCSVRQEAVMVIMGLLD